MNDFREGPHLVSGSGQSTRTGIRHPAHGNGPMVFSDTCLWEAAQGDKHYQTDVLWKRKDRILVLLAKGSLSSILKGNTRHQEARGISYSVSMEDPLSIPSYACLSRHLHPRPESGIIDNSSLAGASAYTRQISLCSSLVPSCPGHKL